MAQAPKFKLGDWVVFDPSPAVCLQGFAPDKTPRMVVDVQDGPLMVVASISPFDGRPCEFLTTQAEWRLA